MPRGGLNKRDRLLELFRTYPVLNVSRMDFFPGAREEIEKLVDEGILKMSLRKVNGVNAPVLYLAEFEDWVKQYHEMADRIYKE
ncbi:MAG TPA: hypothetical protein GXX35_06835 [Thermoanaerobacterales bacterium]|nr:hypothetical protein [Thermoanaerobacterales bacterium]